MKAIFIKFNKWSKRFIAFSSDVAVTLVSWLLACWLASADTINFNLICIFTAIQCFFYLVGGLYRGIWRFASMPDLIRILRAIVLGSIVNLVVLALSSSAIPIKTSIIYFVLLVTLLPSTRLIFRWYSDYPKLSAKGKRVLVVGAGSAGEGLIRDLYRSSYIHEYAPTAFVDDNAMLLGSELQGIRVVGNCADIPRIVLQHKIELIIIAIPSVNSKRMREIVGYCEESKIPFRTLPSLKNITDGVVKISSLREILLEDLLGREQIYHDWDAIQASISHKTILVTGGGGSIGSELCRQICQLAPARLVIVDNCEFNLYSIDMEIQKLKIPVKVYSHLCSVTDKLEIQHIFGQYKPDIVFHVAAYKHVPLLETHIRVSMYNNIIGTKTVAELADQFKVQTFVLISTDKAVNPTSIMGATKRASEVFCQNLNRFSATRFITVRFGNVLDSAGSVIPLFRKQIQSGGPVTVTHPDICRFFMTIPEAAQLILQATVIDNHAEIFVLDMGEPINIRYLAEQMIKLSGKTLGQDIEIEFTGLRPGEKLYEELFHDNEQIQETSHPKISQAKVRHYDWPHLLEIMRSIESAAANFDEQALLVLLGQLVPEYNETRISVKDELEIEQSRSETVSA